MPQSLGLNLLAKTLVEGRLSDFHLLKREYFYEAEVEVYDWIAAHVDRHGELPSMSFTSRRIDIAAPDSDDAYGVYYDDYIERAIYNRFNDISPELQRALTRRRATEALNLITQFVEDSHSVRTDGARDLVNAFQVGEEVLRELRRLRVMHGLSGVPTGWPTLDTITHGFQRGDLIIFAARPGVGKSTAMMRMAATARAHGHVPLLVSMEMPRVQILMRMFAEAAGIDLTTLQAGQMTTHAEQAIQRIVTDLENSTPLYIIEGHFRKEIGEIASIVHSLRPNIVFIDGAYLLKLGTATSRMAKWEVVGEIAQSLKSLAMVTQIPIVASFQITREGAKRKGEVGVEHIQLSDAIGQLASLVIGIFEDEGGDDPSAEVQRRLKVLKGRSGERGQWFINWRWDRMDFTEIVDQVDDDITAEELEDE